VSPVAEGGEAREGGGNGYGEKIGRGNDGYGGKRRREQQLCPL